MNKIIGLILSITLAMILIGALIYCGYAITENNKVQIEHKQYWSIPFSLCGILLMGVGTFYIFFKSFNYLVKLEDEKEEEDNYY
jgi:D-alanyl-lipoteichoic acid acyltransferase DltB (MBOAT superfamily)